MSGRAAVWLGDLTRAVGELEVTREEDIARLARVLGLVHEQARASTPSPVAQPERPPLRSIEWRPISPSGLQRQAMSPDAQHVAHSINAQAAEVEELPPESVFRRAPRRAAPLEVLLGTPAATVEAVDTSLFDRRWQRGILSGFVGTKRAAGDIDVPRIVDEIALGRAATSLPRLSVHTLRAGLQVLVDIGEGMRPYTDDVVAMERLLRDTVGADGLEELRFDRTLADGAGPGTRRTWGPYRPPPPGRPVLVLSDFGLAGGMDVAGGPLAWQPVVQAAAATGCQLLALTPFPATRWPGWLTARFTLLVWDRATNDAAARRAASAAARKGR